MTFTTSVKNEVSLKELNEIENRNLLLGYLYVNALFTDKIIISLENAGVARKIFKTFKYSYKTDVKITLRTQKKFITKNIYIFEINGHNQYFKDELNNLDLNDMEAISSFIKGVFLASGSISDPKKSRYHLEIPLNDENKANYVLAILNKLNFGFKKIKRDKDYVLYLKSSEEISDFLKLLGATNSLFYYEDIRIYRDHKNMVNRLNNCEQANLEKSIKASDKMIETVNYLKANNYMELLDEKTQLVAEYRIKYKEESYQTLAEIISIETQKKVSKSYINHHLRKVQEVYTKIINKA